MSSDHVAAPAHKLTFFCRLLEHTYINLSFAPAPDDTVLNLHRVRRHIRSSAELHVFRVVFRERRRAYRQLQVSTRRVHEPCAIRSHAMTGPAPLQHGVRERRCSSIVSAVCRWHVYSPTTSTALVQNCCDLPICLVYSVEHPVRV